VRPPFFGVFARWRAVSAEKQKKEPLDLKIFKSKGSLKSFFIYVNFYCKIFIAV
jgi:hypothetical protein